LAQVGGPPELRSRRGDDPVTWLEPLIHPTALIEAFAHVDCGTFRATEIGARSWVMKGSHVGHDCLVGDDVELAPLVSIGGECIIGDEVHIGQGAVTVPQITIGARARIGAGAVVTKDVPAGETWVGSPAEEISRSIARRRFFEETEGWREWWDKSRGLGDGSDDLTLSDREHSLPVPGNGLSELEQRQRAHKKLFPGSHPRASA
jgi:acyl-[acyl carrier protein]--UDP-N-acetylglucosamine O-acyltransferase